MKFFALTFAILYIAKLSIIVDGNSSVPSLFIFGDSLVDVGNNNKLPLTLARANVIPNGVDYPSGDPTGRFSNGLNAADFIAHRLGLGDVSPPPYLSLGSINMTIFKGVNFASGGSGIQNITGYNVIQWIPLRTQVSYFMNVRKNLVKLLGETSTQRLINNSLFVFVIGSNDLFSYPDISSKSPQEFIDSLVTLLRIELLNLYNSGLRKLAFLGTGPLGCTPSRRLKNTGNKCEQSLNDMSSSFNMEVESLLANLSSSLDGLNYSIGNTNLIVTEFINNSTSYGFTNTESACCGEGKLRAEFPCILIAQFCHNRREYLFWDLVHPVQRASQMVVDMLFDGPSYIVSPINVGQLIASTS